MRVRIRWMAVLRERLGTPESVVEVPEPATVATLRAVLQEQHPHLAVYWKTVRFARETAYLEEHEALEHDVLLYAIPPVSGGL